MPFPNKFLYFLRHAIPSSIQRTRFLHWCALAYQNKMHPRKALLFYGDHGSGKTLLARLLIDIFGDKAIIGHSGPIGRFEVGQYENKTYTYFEGDVDLTRKLDFLLADELKIDHIYNSYRTCPNEIHPIGILQERPNASARTHIIRFQKPKHRRTDLLDALRTEIPQIQALFLSIHPFQNGDIGYVLGATPVKIISEMNDSCYYQIQYLRDACPNGKKPLLYHRGDYGKAKSLTWKPRDPKFTIRNDELIIDA
jgi:hypothetical protein